MRPLLCGSGMKLHDQSCMYVAIRCVVVAMTQFPRNALMSSTLPLQVSNIRMFRIDETALILLNRRIADIAKGMDVACVLLISVVRREFFRVLRPYAEKRDYAPFSSSQPSKTLLEDSKGIGKFEGFHSCLKWRGVVGFLKSSLSVWVIEVFRTLPVTSTCPYEENSSFFIYHNLDAWAVQYCVHAFWFFFLLKHITPTTPGHNSHLVFNSQSRSLWITIIAHNYSSIALCALQCSYFALSFPQHSPNTFPKSPFPQRKRAIQDGTTWIHRISEFKVFGGSL